MISMIRKVARPFSKFSRVMTTVPKIIQLLILLSLLHYLQVVFGGELGTSQVISSSLEVIDPMPELELLELLF